MSLDVGVLGWKDVRCFREVLRTRSTSDWSVDNNNKAFGSESAPAPPAAQPRGGPPRDVRRLHQLAIVFGHHGQQISRLASAGEGTGM